jgi:hypothetical protein
MELSEYDEDLLEALIDAYPNEGELSRLVKFGLGERLAAIVSRGNLRSQANELIEWAAARGKLDTLFREAIERNPENPKLRKLAGQIGADVRREHEQLAEAARQLSTEPFDNPDAGKVRELLASGDSADGSLQALVCRSAGPGAGADLKAWIEGLKAAHRRVGSVGRGKHHVGTCFLIGPDRVITAGHVVPPGKPTPPLDVVFDFVDNGVDRGSLPTYRLAEELARSPVREADFAIFRLDRTPAGGRDYFRVRTHGFGALREPVHILGHSNADPLRLSNGVVFDCNSLSGIVAYTANTLSGASGSPVFNEALEVVAMHHHGEANVNNHGILMARIVDQLKRDRKAGLIEVGSTGEPPKAGTESGESITIKVERSGTTVPAPGSTTTITIVISLQQMMKSGLFDELVNLPWDADRARVVLESIGYPRAGRPKYPRGDDWQSFWLTICTSIDNGLLRSGRDLAPLVEAVARLFPANPVWKDYTRGIDPRPGAT